MLVAHGTYPERYDSADVVEYHLSSPPGGPHGLVRYADVALGRMLGARPLVRRPLRDALAEQDRWAPAVVVAHNAPQAVRLVRSRLHVAVLYAHNELFRSYSRREAGRVLDRVFAVVCVSDFLAESTAARLPSRLHDRVVVVRNGVDPEVFHREAPPGSAAVVEVVFVGRMLPEKGADVLVDACARLDRPDLRLTVVGSSGFDRSAPLTSFERGLRRRALPLGDRVRFEPFADRARVADLLSSADVAVVPSRWPEPFALTVLEGMAAGAAVVASEIGGIPESVRKVGLLVPPGDVIRLAEALEALADDREYLESLGRSCLAYARTHDWRWASERLHHHLQGL